jgi:hypothetical protein
VEKKADIAQDGTSQGHEGGIIPNITPDKKTDIGRWSDDDLKELLQSGMLPDSDFIGNEMGEVVDQATSKMSDADINAMIVCLRSLPPIHNAVESKKKK